MSARYPLTWPGGWKRTPAADRRRGRFSLKSMTYGYESMTIGAGVKRVVRELERLAARESSVLISSNLKTRRDGFPLADQAEPADPGIAVYWSDARQFSRAIACDLYTRAADNLAAIAATLEAMRAIERHGGAQILNRVFTGFEALPAPRSCWEVLHILATRDRDTIERAFRVRARIVHPDHGGTAAAFTELAAAREAALAEAGL